MGIIAKWIKWYDKNILGLEPTENYYQQKTQLTIEMFKDKRKKWRFRILSANHKILCSSEAYSRKSFCLQTAELIRDSDMIIEVEQ